MLVLFWVSYIASAIHLTRKYYLKLFIKSPQGGVTTIFELLAAILCTYTPLLNQVITLIYVFNITIYKGRG